MKASASPIPYLISEPIHPLERMEMELLLEGIYRHYGYDFRSYSAPSLRRRIWHRIRQERLETISDLQARVLHDRDAMERLLADLSIQVTELFRDPSFFIAFRRQVVPVLRSLPLIRIWHAGCSTGEEAYSMAILLHEEGLGSRSTIYATDMNRCALEQAASGALPIDKMQLYTKQYLQAGGDRSFSEYYTAGQDGVYFRPFLAKNIVFSAHNLVTDHSFNEFHAIICRNVLIYFNEELQMRVIGLFHESLAPSGFLGLGAKECIKRDCGAGRFEKFDIKAKLYRKSSLSQT